MVDGLTAAALAKGLNDGTYKHNGAAIVDAHNNPVAFVNDDLPDAATPRRANFKAGE
jgi:hypothetical protein